MIRSFFVFILLLAALASTGFCQKSVLAWVTAKEANVRVSPSNSSAVMGTEKQGSLITLISADDKNGWYEVQRTGATGWIRGNTIRIEESTVAINQSISLIDWNLLQETSDSETGGYKLYSRVAGKKWQGNSVSVWTRIEPTDPVKFRRASRLPKNFAYGLQFLTIDCDSDRISQDRLIPYTKSGELINFRTSSYSFYNPIVPGSLGEDLERKLCK
jgi:hypothetical protein